MTQGTCQMAIDTETEKAHKLAPRSGLRAYINGVDLSNKTQLSDISNDIYAKSLCTLPPNMSLISFYVL